MEKSSSPSLAQSLSPWRRRMFPPYYKYAVFLLAGFELVFSCLVLAIAEAYYKSAALLLPIAYRIFDDTVDKKQPGFEWTPEARAQLDLYKLKMLVLWATCTMSVLVCMLVIIPQFFDFNDSRGNRSHLCLVRQRLGLILFVVQAVLAVAVGLSLIWAWFGCGEAVDLFRKLFDSAQHEEVFVSELENKLDCVADDDKEVPVQRTCPHQLRTSMIEKSWMDGLLALFLVGHAVLFLLVPFFNRQLIKNDEDDDENDDNLLKNSA